MKVLHVQQALALNERTGGLTERELQEGRLLIATKPPNPKVEPGHERGG